MCCIVIHAQGTLSTTDVKAKFVNGKPQIIEAKYNMRSQLEWDRFMRFMDRWVTGQHSRQILSEASVASNHVCRATLVYIAGMLSQLGSALRRVPPSSFTFIISLMQQVFISLASFGYGKLK
jgi:hypothetical protein